MIVKKGGHNLVQDERVMSMYKEGFSHVSAIVDRLNFFSKESFSILSDSYRETNEQQLEQIRKERLQLEIEIKYFLARANSKMMYLVELEEHLQELQRQFDEISKEALEEPGEEERGKRLEKEA
ncbi:hypothetical protein [Paenibacillus popilliae]|uniref:Ribosomal protein L17 n=1 Tax=Paenibacillus popilliae ATCC 14706 TaxID=1212764 RepID=M9LYQ6_PAEPP|nr:hypothetical protein [Paenibacillus popilliae]GAC41289.1 ribosomal protein L17 [Paenibacillus popilliae ATCC 14706]